MHATIKYTVFISSTFDDLKVEREQVADAILKMGLIPCGMEQFSASSGRGWNIITQTIDVCDYYVLLVAGRYGTLFPGEVVSWTEKEFDYARSRGLDPLVFLRNKDYITGSRMDDETSAVKSRQALLRKIDEECHRENWTTGDDLCARVTMALMKQINDDQRFGKQRPGWFRGDDLPKITNLTNEISRLSAENAELRAALTLAQTRPKSLLELQGPQGEKLEFEPQPGATRFPKATLRAPALQVKDQTITVSWAPPQDPVIGVTGFVARYRPRPNEALDGIRSHAAENEAFKELKLAANASTASLGGLRDNTDYEVSVCAETIVGRSEWSPSAIERTAKLPSEASQLITFFSNNRDALTHASGKRWELTAEAKPTLFLGNSVVAERTCASGPFQGMLAIRIVDVAPQYRPEIKAADVSDSENTKVLVFVGTAGHGKTTQINSFVSFLLDGDLRDAARILTVDDRGMNQASSVTQFVTCYRLRPLSQHFKGKTLLIVDTPGYGDTEGLQRDRFGTAAMSEFLTTIQHVNAVIFTCRANETRTTILSPVSTYVFSLFAKNVRRCLRTIYTFSDVGTPQTRKVLQQLEWPVENGEVEVNNAAFAVVSPDDNPTMRYWWQMSMNGQHLVLQMLLGMGPVPTELSAQVTTDRLKLEGKCELAEKKILRTANDARHLLANLDALADAVGAAPGDTVAVTVTDVKEEPVPDGKTTILCTGCNHTCHEICACGDDNKIFNCSAMSGGYCTVCPGRCHWTKHKSARFILRPVQRTEMVVPEDLIKRWNSNNNSLEGALLDAIARYLELQGELRLDIEELAALTEKLNQTALLYTPEALVNYVDTLIQMARARGAPAEQLVQLMTAKHTLVLAAQIKRGAQGATRDSTVLQDVLGAVQCEMRRRMDLHHQARAKEETKSCHLYNRLRDSLPPELKDKAPAPLKEAGLMVGKGALYPDNLKAVVKLVQLVLTDGGVVAALATA